MFYTSDLFLDLWKFLDIFVEMCKMYSISFDRGKLKLISLYWG